MYYLACILETLGIISTSGNPICSHSWLSKKDVLQNLMSDFNKFNIPINENEFEIPYLHCVSKLHKNPYKEKYFVGSSK